MPASLRIIYTCLRYAAGAGLAGAFLLAGGLWYFQRRLIYPADMPSGSRKLVPKPSDIGLAYEDVTLQTRDGIKIKAYVIPARRQYIPVGELQSMTSKERKERGEQAMHAWAEELASGDAVEYAKSRPTVVIFHANAGNMGHRLPLARKLHAEHGCNVFMLSYRGYGMSEGHPSEHGMRIDAETALEYITTHPLLGDTKLVLYGQSIGGAVCLYAASRHPDLISGLIIENTFLSLASLIPLVLPQVPTILIPILLTEHWDASASLPLIPKTTPILFMAGKKDELVAPSQMKALKALRGDGKYTWKEFEGGHNDTCLIPQYWMEIGKWLKEEIESEEEKRDDPDEKRESVEEKSSSEDDSGWEHVEDK
ncbi:Alpha/Beta hydrolase protein [Naematelia encephala]|uniref:Alpha/Beta hydrolase protein n=1 Tax=Naematelia encephala TaxID=71784 RepID=A0A1Y2B953_9TREE|nr:Alpha/Beta hydrolase protein [Naematelia encephala]